MKGRVELGAEENAHERAGSVKIDRERLGCAQRAQLSPGAPAPALFTME